MTESNDKRLAPGNETHQPLVEKASPPNFPSICSSVAKEGDCNNAEDGDRAEGSNKVEDVFHTGDKSVLVTVNDPWVLHLDKAYRLRVDQGLRRFVGADLGRKPAGPRSTL